jgi:hypothetical protein
VLDICGKVIGVGQVCVLFSRHSSICIVSVFLDIPAKRVNMIEVLSIPV